jgi:hypothetical protein
MLTAFVRFLAEILTVSQLLKNSPKFYVNRHSLSPHLCVLSEINQIHFPCPISWILIYSSIYAYVFQVVFFTLFSQPKTSMHLFSTPISATCPTHLMLETVALTFQMALPMGNNTLYIHCFTFYRGNVLRSKLQSSGIWCRPLFYKHNDVSEGRLPPQRLSHCWALYINQLLALLNYVLYGAGSFLRN